MVNSRSIRQLTSLVAAVAVVGAIGVLPAAAAAGGIWGAADTSTTTTLWLDSTALEHGDAVTGEVSVVADGEGDDVLTGEITLLVDDVEEQTWTIDDQTLLFDLGTWVPGDHTVTAVFEGDDDYATSTDAVGFTVAMATSSITLVQTSELVFGAAGWITFVIETDADVAPTGDVTLTDGGEVIAEGMVEIDPESSGFGTVTLDLPAALEPGVHSVVLAYDGNGTVEPSESAELDVEVAPALTTVTVWSLPAPLVVGQQQTLVVEVAPLAGHVAEGSVLIETDGAELGEAFLVAGRGELEVVSPLPAGATPLFLFYSGDEYFGSSEAEGSVETGKGQPVVTVSVPASVAYGVAAAGQVTVRLPDGDGGDAPVAATRVTLTATRDGVTVDAASGDTDADGGWAFELPGDLDAADWTIDASIDETSETFAASGAAVLSVTKLASVATATLGSAGGTYGSSTPVIARVAERTADGTAASGMVQIVVDDDVRSTQPLVAGAVTVDLPGDLTMGAHRVVVRYAGTAGVAGGESDPAAYTVRKATSATAVALSAASVQLGAGGAVATITVTVPAARSVGPTGTVVLLNGADTVGTYPLAGGSVAVPLPSSLALGAHALTARFEGSAELEASTSDAATLTIVAATTTTPAGTSAGTGAGAGATPEAAPVTRSAKVPAKAVSAASRVLAATGANVEGLVGGALALLALGTVTVLAARRRSARTVGPRAD